MATYPVPSGLSVNKDWQLLLLKATICLMAYQEYLQGITGWDESVENASNAMTSVWDNIVPE